MSRNFPDFPIERGDDGGDEDGEGGGTGHEEAMGAAGKGRCPIHGRLASDLPPAEGEGGGNGERSHLNNVATIPGQH